MVCLQMKKACLTVRQQMMNQMQQKGELPLSMMGQVGGEGIAATLPPRPSQSPKLSARSSTDFSGLADAQPERAKLKAQQSRPDVFTREIQACLTLAAPN